MSILDRAINTRLGCLERCAEMAPAGTYDDVKSLVEIIHEQSDAIRNALRAAGFKGANDDNLRNLEGAIYRYILASNPDCCAIPVGEGFGHHVDGPAGKRIIEQAARDRDALSVLATFKAVEGAA